MKRLSLLAAVLALALALAAALSSCSQGPTESEKKAVCFGNEARVGAVMKLFKADSGMDAPLDRVLGEMKAVCPSGGTYTWDPQTETLTCSIHGHP
jgi:hypothetical protein